MIKSKKKTFWKILRFILVLSLVILVGIAAFEMGSFLTGRNHGEVTVESFPLEESAKALKNPDRGFYEIYGYEILDEEQEFAYLLSQELYDDKDTALSMIQINLQNYSGGPISEQGLKNIDTLFQALAVEDKHYLIRFLYDWDGENLENEPEDVEIILTHMEQLEDIFSKYEDIIFMHQGLFIGNWGEMNGSNHLDEIETLAQKLEEVTGESTYLAVRKPSQWRTITGIANINEENMITSALVMRLGLFNDGMLGNEWDYGTYGTKSKEEVGMFNSWNREEELDFQEKLCQFVPNGGEVIYSNSLNDLASAVQYLAKTHVTYLNRAYDKNVLEKWKNTTVTEEGVFYGMDGLSYVERHLGYRLLISHTNMTYDFYQDKLTVDVSLQNVGFAPMYENPNLYLVIENTESKEATTYPISGDVCQLAGGLEKEKILTVQKEISLAGFEAGQYQLYFYMEDADSKVHIQLANEPDEESYGYIIGQMQLGTVEEWIEGALHKE